MAQLQGKVAFITGAASGIGAACARGMAREGAAVFLTDVDTARGEQLARNIEAAGGRAAFLFQDVTDDAAWPDAIAAAERAFGRIDVMVANAGIAVFGPALEMSYADYKRQNAINIDGVWLSIKSVVPAMQRAGGGSIVVMSSVAGLRGSAMLAAYSATKGAVRYMAKSWALECAQMGIRVNSVHPGIIKTAIWDKVATPAGGGRNAPLDPNVLALAGVPIGVPSDPEEIANGVIFLASDAARHMTGSELVIDGGMTAGSVRRT